VIFISPRRWISATQYEHFSNRRRIRNLIPRSRKTLHTGELKAQAAVFWQTDEWAAFTVAEVLDCLLADFTNGRANAEGVVGSEPRRQHFESPHFVIHDGSFNGVTPEADGDSPFRHPFGAELKGRVSNDIALFVYLLGRRPDAEITDPVTRQQWFASQTAV
jgi:hypothetical protein